jgi:zinc protease
VLRRPSFDEERFNRIRDDNAAEAKNDEDDSSVLAVRHMRQELYGEHAYARFRSKDSLAKLTRVDAKAFHKANVLPGRVVLAVSGRFEAAAMKKLIAKCFGTWRGGDAGWPAVDPVAPAAAERGITVLDHPDMTAAYAELGHLGVKAGSKEEPALLLTDHIWGSGSFTSRVVAKVRTEEGLAYTCGSDFDQPPMLPGVVRTYMQCQAGEASFALKLALSEARRLAASGPTASELERAKQALTGKFPARFTTAADRARALAEADLDGLPDDYFAKYRQRILAVTAEDVKAAAARFYGQDGLVVVIVGPLASVRKSVARGTSLDDLGKVKVE